MAIWAYMLAKRTGDYSQPDGSAHRIRPGEPCRRTALARSTTAPSAALLAVLSLVGPPGAPPAQAQPSASPAAAKALAPAVIPALRVPGPLSARNASYKMRASLDAAAHKVTAHGTLVWRNLESQPVDHLVFHLYQNAFKNFASQFIRDSGPQLRGTTMPAKGWGYIDVTGVRIGQAELLAKSTVVDTLMTVPLPTPLGPSATVEVELDWTVQLPKVFARSGWADDYHAVTQWFPKIGVWDCGSEGNRCSWRAHQYHGSTEFFADYGVYDVELEVPAGTLIGATGVRTSERTEGSRRIERYHAEDVADFAWFTDPRFIAVEQHVADEFGGITVRLLTRRGQEPTIPRHFAAVSAALLEGERRFGIYPYRNATVIIPPPDGSGSGGMEYPTILTSFSFPAPEGVRVLEVTTAHEFGHQFLYHLIGTDEVEEAWLDEGLNETFTSWVMERMYPRGCTVLNLPYLCLNDLDNDWLVYRGTTRRATLAMRSFELPRGSYGQISYNHTAVILRTLERYLGAARMEAGMRTYAERYRFRHPRRSDFTAAMNEGADEDLGWFWNQALTTSRVADYEVLRLSSDSHQLAAGYWDCPPRPLPAAVNLPDAEDDRTRAELHQLWKETNERACLGKAPGRYELPVEEDKPKKGAGKDGKESKASYDTEVTVYRRGDFLFPVTIKVQFVDGSTEYEKWTLAEQQAEPERRFKVLRYLRRPSLVHSAEVDPQQQLLLDEKRINNGLLATADKRPVRRLWLSFEGAVQTLLDLLAL